MIKRKRETKVVVVFTLNIITKRYAILSYIIYDVIDHGYCSLIDKFVYIFVVISRYLL